MTTTIRVTTAARYRGLAVTVFGDMAGGLLAVAGYGTADEVPIAAIAVKRRAGQRVYCVSGRGTWTASVAVAAAEAVKAREARDHRSI